MIAYACGLGRVGLWASRPAASPNRANVPIVPNGAKVSPGRHQTMGAPPQTMGAPPDAGTPPQTMGAPPQTMGAPPQTMGAPPDDGTPPQTMGAPGL